MFLFRASAALRALLCLLMLISPGQLAFATPSPSVPLHSVAAAPSPVSQTKDETCGRGKATKDFGWRVVDFGVSTLKYLIGLFIIPIGLFLVIVGALLQMVEAVAC